MKDKTIKNIKIKSDIKKKSLTADDMKKMKGGDNYYYCCGRPPG